MAENSAEVQKCKQELRKRKLCLLCRSPTDADGLARELGIEGNKYVLDGLIEREKIDYRGIFYLGTFGQDERKLEYYLACPLPSKRSFVVRTTLLFHHLHPQFALYVGSCVGLRGIYSSKMGDVILGDQAIINYEGAWSLFSPPSMLSSEGSQPYKIKEFVDLAENPKYLYRSFASGVSAEIDSISQIEEAQSTLGLDPPASGIDTEAGNFLELCQLNHVISLGIIKEVTSLIGGISKTDAVHTKRPMHMCANAARALIEGALPLLHQQIRLDILKASEEPSETDQPQRLCNQYYGNFLNVVLDNYAQGQSVRLKTNTLVEFSGVKGVKIVMPPAMQALFFHNSAIFYHILKEFRLQSVLIGGEESRDLYHVAGYLVDFPRLINGLAQEKHSTYQVERFQHLLQSKPPFSAGAGASQALICTWKEFLDWLNEEDPDEELSGERKVAATGAASSDTKSLPAAMVPGNTTKLLSESTMLGGDLLTALCLVVIVLSFSVLG